MSNKKERRNPKAVIRYCPKCGEEMLRFKNLSYDCPECQKKRLPKSLERFPWLLMCPKCQYLEGEE